jgi:hypothetical protein
MKTKTKVKAGLTEEEVKKTVETAQFYAKFWS